MPTGNADERLSTQEYWDEVLRNARLPRVNSPQSYLYKVTMDFVHKHISGGNYSSFLEVGCGSSGWLPYFAKRYGLSISGIDYSEIGCQLAEKNLQMLNIPYEDIFCRDLFAPNATEGKKYDIVFSYGVIEHFDQPENVVKILSGFTNDNGLIITLVPNLTGLAGLMTKRYMPDVYAIHNVFDASMLRKIHDENKLEILANGYAGMFSIGVMPLHKANKGILKKASIGRSVSMFILKSYDKIATTLFKLLPIRISSRFLSPYVICVARKKTT